LLWAEHVARNTAGEREDVFAEVKRQFTHGELVELTGICGLFAVSNRFQDSMRLPIEEQGEVDKIRQSVRADPKRLKAYVARLVDHWPHAFPSPLIPLPGGEGSMEPPSPSGRRAGDEGGLTGERRQRIADATSTAPADCRVPLLDPALGTGDTARFFAAAERLLGGVPNAVRVWGHVPHVGKLVLPFFVAIERAGCGGVLPPAIKLLVIARTSHINAASYTLAHVLANAHAEGVPEGLMDELATAGCVSSPRISERERAALVWAHHVAQNTAKHHDAVFGELKRHYNDAEIVELTGLCAETNMVNRFCNALRVPIESAESLATLCRAPRVDPARLKTYLATVLADWPQQLPVPDATVV
jgi:alkylhydroperoxidase family enzyme